TTAPWPASSKSGIKGFSAIGSLNGGQHIPAVHVQFRLRGCLAEPAVKDLPGSLGRRLPSAN
ncbi:MAG: hypothetical protein ACRESZ_20125, partial [Methylococcales bacterium]